MPVLQIALVILAALLAARWTLSPLLALLVAGIMARRWLGHRFTVEPNFGSAGAALTVLLFISIGVMFTLEGFAQCGRGCWRSSSRGSSARASPCSPPRARAVSAGGRPAALTLALQPMSSLAVLLAADTFGWPAQLPRMDAACCRRCWPPRR